MLVLAKKFDEALKSLSEIKKLNLDDKTQKMVTSLQISCYVVKGELSKAEKMTKELSKKSEDLGNFHLAQVYAKKGDYDKALNHIDKSIESNENFDAYYLKAEILKAKNDNSWKEWMELGKEMEQDTINKVEEGAKAHGLSIKKKKGFLEVA